MKIGVHMRGSSAVDAREVRRLRARRAGRPVLRVVVAPPDVVVSAQALCLHALGLVTSVLTGREGLIGRLEADELAEQCGAVVDELLEVGLWTENDLCYVIPAATSARSRRSD